MPRSNKVNPATYLAVRVGGKRQMIRVTERKNGRVCGLCVRKDADPVETTVADGVARYLVIASEADIIGPLKLDRHYGELVPGDA